EQGYGALCVTGGAGRHSGAAGDGMTEITEARTEFAAWAAAERADWEPAAVGQVLVAARTAGWGWARMGRGVGRPGFTADGELRRLRRSIGDTRRPASPADPKAKATLIAEAKAACEEATERLRGGEDERGAS